LAIDLPSAGNGTASEKRELSMPARTIVIILVVIAALLLLPLFYWGFWHRTMPMTGGPGPHMSGQTPLAEVRVPDLSAAAEQGRAVFEANCAACHGQNAAGVEGKGPPLVHIIYEPNHHGDQAFRLAAVQGVRSHHWRFGDMPPVPGVVPADVERIIAYVRELQRANGIY
jgi:cytochrome c5